MADSNFFNLFNDIDEKYINEAQHLSSYPETNVEFSSSFSRRWAVPAAAVGAAACIALIFGVAWIRADLRSKKPVIDISVDALVPETTFNDGIGNSFLLRGTPINRDDLADFTYDGAVEKCREMLADDEELKAVLSGAPDGVEELYYRARALAEMAGGAPGFINTAFMDSVLADPKAAVIEVAEDTPSYLSSAHLKKGDIYRETGYSYDSFRNALCAVFDENTAMQMLTQNPYFYNYNGQLFCALTATPRSYGILHTEYVLEESSDSSFTFKTVNYFPTIEMSRSGETDYDPAKKADYITTEISNSFFRIIGRWRVNELCMLGSHSAWKGDVIPEGSLVVNGSELKFGGVMLPDSELESVRLAQLNAEYRDTLGNDAELKALFESLGSERSGLIELYCRARALADFIGQYEPIRRYLTSSAMNGKTAAYIYDPWYGYPRGMFIETGLRYGELYDELQKTFISGGLDKLLETFPNIRDFDGALFVSNSVRPRDNILHTEYELVENSDNEIVFYTLNYLGQYDSFGLYDSAEYDPSLKDSYYTQRVLNRIVRTDTGWQAAEISVFGTASSAGTPEIYDDPVKPGETVAEDGRAIRVDGKPLDCSELKTELDYGEYYNALRNKDTSVYSFNGEYGLVDFLSGLDSDAAEVYLRAAALMYVIADGEYTVYNGARIFSGIDEFVQTGYTPEAFSNAMRGVFTVEASQTVPANLGIFLSYDGQLWQMSKGLLGTVYVTNEYELVKNTDTEIVFNTRVYRSFNGEEAELIDTVNNRIVKTESGWRVDEMCLWGKRSSAEPEINSDVTLDDTREMLNVIKEYSDRFCGLINGVTVDTDQPFTENGTKSERYFKVLDGPVKTQAELDEMLDGLLNENGRRQFDKEMFSKCYRADSSGDLYYGEALEVSLEFVNTPYLIRAHKPRFYTDIDIALVDIAYNLTNGNFGSGYNAEQIARIYLMKTADGWRIDDLDSPFIVAAMFKSSSKIVCGTETIPLG
ncbi:MAG: hypothetical protein K2N38_03045 [Oscillospiraceae bacterium]|nr:hypothetical protein [Oscillospiraceae bacterium]